jgi:hypothetical protein
LYVERVASVKRFYDGVRTIQVDRTRLETPKPDTNKPDVSKPDVPSTDSPEPDATKPAKGKKRGSLLNQQ